MNVLQLLDLARITYDLPQFVAGPEGRDGASIFTYANGDTVLAFRGTTVNRDAASFLDWLNDFHADLIQDDAYPGRVHTGFAASVRDLWGSVFEAMEAKDILDGKTPWDKRGRLWITGHSKGGALAQLAAVRCADLNPVAVTFGSPMVGDLRFASYYPERIRVFRYENDTDLVPLFPGHMAGYREVGVTITQKNMPRPLRELAVGELIAKGDWKQIHDNHALATGYNWIPNGDDLPPAAKQGRAA